MVTAPTTYGYSPYDQARLAKGLSRRTPTIISGPEIMDKYAGRLGQE
jgi:hypothetical protein